jgi:acyl-CoA reductase-like NAD-dependent aldehyde dehydrogenase
MDPTLITRHRGDYLCGSFFQRGADGWTETRDPSTGVALDRVPYRRAAVDEGVADARRAAAAWADTPLEERARVARDLRDLLQARRGQLAAMVAREMGKPLWEAGLEIVAAARALDLLLEQAQELLTPVPHPSSQGVLRRRPVGVVAALTPFPYPIYGPVQMLLPCLLAGNAVVWKPSSHVPLSSQKVCDVFDAVRLPRGVLSMIQGPRDPIGALLAAHPDVDMVVAAGAGPLRAAIREQAGPRRRSWVQAGGKGWAIVCADADLDRAAYEVVTGAFLTGGQRCNATSRVLVEAEVARPFLKRVVALTGALTIAAPTEPNCFCGPLVDQAALSRFFALLKEYARAGVQFPVEGGAAALPAKLRRRGQCYVAPAIGLLEGELPDDVPSPEDVEGPLLLARLVPSAEEAADAYSRHPYGMAAAVFTESEGRFEALAARLHAGAVNWNRGTIVASARYPNAGLRDSGDGAEGNGALITASTWPQATLAAGGRFDPSHRVPGMAWPEVMGVVDPSSLTTPPWRPEDDTVAVPVADLAASGPYMSMRSAGPGAEETTPVAPAPAAPPRPSAPPAQRPVAPRAAGPRPAALAVDPLEDTVEVVAPRRGPPTTSRRKR